MDTFRRPLYGGIPDARSVPESAAPPIVGVAG